MAICEHNPSDDKENMKEEGLGEDGGSDTDDDEMLDDSDDDPTFDMLEETRSGLSRLSLKKTRPGIKVSEGEPETIEVKIPELDEKDGKCFEKVEKIIKDGQVEKLKIDQCKVYLRKYALRLTGNKDVLMKRIKEHLEVIEGGGEKKYPTSSFVLNCKGDACEGDVVMFEQNVYDMFSIASRSATGPPCGTRIVAGRIVKESYGAAKQQHTFTIEVLWSKGEKPLPPLHPLLIKGRNLYRLKTVRQRWADEDERRKVLQEKHKRGYVARFSRENRIQEKEMRKMSNAKRMKESNTNRNQNQVNPIKPDAFVQQQIHIPTEDRNQHQVNPIQQQNLQHRHEAQHHQNPIKQQNNSWRQPLQTITGGLLPTPQNHQIKSDNPMVTGPSNTAPLLPKPQNYASVVRSPQAPKQASFWPHHHHQHYPNSTHTFHNRQPLSSLNSPQRSLPQQHPRQPCKYYRHGRCFYADNCKYLHE